MNNLYYIRNVGCDDETVGLAQIPDKYFSLFRNKRLLIIKRVLPPEYMWFHGDGRHNHFRDSYRGGNRWDWSLDSPYED